MTFTTLSESIPLVDISTYLTKNQPDDSCDAISRSLQAYGAVLIHDPRVQPHHSNSFLDMMERYFSQPDEIKAADARPTLFYQVGATPSGIERPRDNTAIAELLQPSQKPLSDLIVRPRDPKWRFFWRCGDRPVKTDFPELNAPQVIPAAFQSEWASTMDAWGSSLLSTLFTIAEMLAIGLNFPIDALRAKMLYGPHLLAPTGSDMSACSKKVGDTIAGYHYDINMLTIHGPSRYPGLYVWTNKGKRIPVVVPEGCLLVQSGIQLEYLTAGLIRKGMHEVVVSEETCAAASDARERNACMWRVSSTLFGHVRSDTSLDPLGQLGERQGAQNYRGLRAGEQIAKELHAIGLAK